MITYIDIYTQMATSSKCICGIYLIGSFKALGHCASCDKVLKSELYLKLKLEFEAYAKIYRFTMDPNDEYYKRYMDAEKRYTDLLISTSNIVKMSDDALQKSRVKDATIARLEVAVSQKNQYIRALEGELDAAREEIDRLEGIPRNTDIEQLFDEFPEKRCQGNDTCAICQVDMVNGEIIKSLKCNHNYHQICLYKHMNESVNCPVCRGLLQSGSIDIALYTVDVCNEEDNGEDNEEDNDEDNEEGIGDVNRKGNNKKKRRHRKRGRKSH